MIDADKKYLAERGSDILIAADAILTSTAKFRCVDQMSHDAIMRAVEVVNSVRRWMASGDCLTSDYMKDPN